MFEDEKVIPDGPGDNGRTDSPGRDPVGGGGGSPETTPQHRGKSRRPPRKSRRPPMPETRLEPSALPPVDVQGFLDLLDTADGLLDRALSMKRKVMKLTK